MTARKRLRYRFDRALSRGPLVVISYLAAVMLVIILAAATVLSVLHLTGITVDGSDATRPLSFGEAFWQSLLRVLDSGTFASDNDWATRIVSLLVTLSGIFLAGSLIGLIANAVDQRVEDLRKGRSDVLESGHTLVLGWSPRLATILSELVSANANHRGQVVVVLADRAKDEMEDELRRLVPIRRTTRVVCRTGDVAGVDDLERVGLARARSVIVLAGEAGDAGVVKAVLAVRSVDPDFTRIRLVAEFEDAGYAASLRNLTDGRIATVQADDVISQVTAQACHQSGLARVVRDLLDFEGDEIYFRAVPELTGHTYRDALLAFEHAAVLGLLHDGHVLLNPPLDEVFADGDEVIAVAADDDEVVFTGFRDHVLSAAAGVPSFTAPRRRIAIIGWSGLACAVVHELDEFLAPGSVIDVLVDGSVLGPQDVDPPPGERSTVSVRTLRPGPQPLIDVLRANRYDQAIVLGYRHGMDAATADARSMLTLLALHRAWQGDPRRPRLIAEMLDRANVEIAQSIGVDDFIVSDEVSSLMMAQISERLELHAVFDELFGATGCFLSLHPAPLYAGEEETTFASVVSCAAARGATVLGFRIGQGAVTLNPAKSTIVRLGADDEVLVLAHRLPHAAAPAVEVGSALSSRS